MSTETHRSVTFLYPSRGLGGAQLLFLRLARELGRRAGPAVQVVDFADGFLARGLAGAPSVGIIPFAGRPVQVPEGTTIVTPLSHLADLEMLMRPVNRDVGFLFWSIHPENVMHLLDGMGRRWVWGRDGARRSIRELAEAGSLAYMDSANERAVAREAGPLPSPRYLPIPHGFDGVPTGPRRRDDDRLHVAWLGRVADDKIFAIRKIVDEIRASAERDSITLHVIGDGGRTSDLIAYLDAARIAYQMAGVLMDDALSGYLARHVDVGIAMGTSCLEFAARGVPALLIDYSLAPFPSVVRYNWLFETDAYTLGDHVETAVGRRHTFADVLAQLRHDPGLGERSREYATRCHGISAITDTLLTLAAGAWRPDPSMLGHIQAGAGRGPYRHLLGAARRSWSAARRLVRDVTP